MEPGCGLGGPLNTSGASSSYLRTNSMKNDQSQTLAPIIENRRDSGDEDDTP